MIKVDTRRGSRLDRQVKIGALLVAVQAGSFMLSMPMLSVDLYTFVVTLTRFQSHVKVFHVLFKKLFKRDLV